MGYPSTIPISVVNRDGPGYAAIPLDPRLKVINSEIAAGNGTETDLGELNEFLDVIFNQDIVTFVNAGRINLKINGVELSSDDSKYRVGAAGQQAESLITITFGDPGNWVNGMYGHLAGVKTSATVGYQPPVDVEIITISIGRDDADAADIEIMVDGVVGDTIATPGTGPTSVISVNVNADQVIAVRNKSGGNNITDGIVTITMRPR